MKDLIKKLGKLSNPFGGESEIFIRLLERSDQLILILPGLDESVLEYDQFFENLSIMFPDYSLLGIDLRGQGKTLELEGNINSYQITLNDQLEIIQSVLQDISYKKLFLVGLSYGAGVALHVANRLENVSGLALMAPYISKIASNYLGVGPFQKMASQFSLPLYFSMARHRGNLNRNVNWSEDRLKVLTKLSLGILELDTKNESMMLPDLEYGIHLLIGDRDPLVSVNSVEKFYDSFTTENKTINILPGIGHRLIMKSHSICTEWLAKIFR